MVIDPSAAYAAAVTTEVLPHAVLVVDHFHLVKLANDALTAVRRRVTFDAHGAGYASTAPAPSGPAPDSPPSCPVNFEEPTMAG